MKDQTTISKLFMVSQAEQMPAAWILDLLLLQNFILLFSLRSFFHKTWILIKYKVQNLETTIHLVGYSDFLVLTQQIIGLHLVQGFVASLYTLHGPFLRAQGINWQISTREKRISKGISCEKSRQWEVQRAKVGIYEGSFQRNVLIKNWKIRSDWSLSTTTRCSGWNKSIKFKSFVNIFKALPSSSSDLVGSCPGFFLRKNFL